jgi:hypothetical protein
MEALEKRGVSFVSVTQQFNTTSSMGRLTLNILLSFAQFEREIISERTRDKIAAARRKGKWSGGRPILGYDVAPGGGRLVVNDDEAARVRAIYEVYLDRQSLIETITELRSRGGATKRNRRFRYHVSANALNSHCFAERWPPSDPKGRFSQRLGSPVAYSALAIGPDMHYNEPVPRKSSISVSPEEPLSPPTNSVLLVRTRQQAAAPRQHTRFPRPSGNSARAHRERGPFRAQGIGWN